MTNFPDDFDRRFHNIQRFITTMIIVIVLMIVTTLGAMLWLSYRIVQIGPNGIAAEFGQAIKAR